MKITRKQLRQLIKEEVSSAEAEAAAEEVLVVAALDEFFTDPEARVKAKNALVSKLREQPELVQHLAVAVLGGTKGIRAFLKSLGMGD